MTRPRHYFLRSALALLALACGGDAAPATELPSARAASIAFDATTAIVGVRASVRLTPTIRDAQGQDIAATAAVQWKTSDATLATVNDTGAVTGVRLGGPVTITATSNGHSAAVVYTVTPALITIAPAVSALAVNSTLQYSGIAVDGLGAPLDAGAVTWSSSDIGIATVDQNGLVTGKAAGNTQIIASAGGRSTSIGLLVGVPSVYDGTFVSITPPVQLTVLFGSVVHFDGSFTPLSICSVSVTAALNFPITSTGSMQIFLGGTGSAQLLVTFGSSNSATGTVHGPTPQQCMQGVSNPSGIQYGQFIAHKF